MNTVKHFKDLGLEFVVGDECCDEGEHPFAGKWVDHVNRGDGNWDLDEVKKFAWRENTGKAPAFKGEIEVRHRDGCVLTEPVHMESWDITGGVGDIIEWRPLLTQPKPQQEKPIYTQEMADAKALVPVGAEYRLGDGSVYLCVAHHCKGGIVGEGKSKVLANHHHCIHNILPLKTQRDIEIDLIGELIGEMINGATSKNDFERLHKMGYRVTKVEE